MTEDQVLGFLRWCRRRGLLLVAAGVVTAPTTSTCTSHADADADDAYSASQGDSLKLGTGTLTYTHASSTRAVVCQALSATDVVRCICSYL
jgi:hypothetical protein